MNKGRGSRCNAHSFGIEEGLPNYESVPVLYTGGGSVHDRGPKLAVCLTVTPFLAEAAKRQLLNWLFNRGCIYLSLNTILFRDYRDFHRVKHRTLFGFLNLSLDKVYSRSFSYDGIAR